MEKYKMMVNKDLLRDTFEKKKIQLRDITNHYVGYYYTYCGCVCYLYFLVFIFND